MRNHAVFAVAVLVASAVFLFPGCGDDDPADPVDTTPPAAVTDLRVLSFVGPVVTLAWTAPGDDGADGAASSYDIRYSPTAVTEATWPSCAKATGLPAPAAAGVGQTAAIDVGSKSDVYLALKASDEVPNWSGLSNVVSASDDVGIRVRQLTTEDHNVHPCVNDGVVCWVRKGVDGDEIYVANVNTANPSPTRLTDDGGEKAHPSSHGSVKIVWQRRDDGIDDWEIYSYFHLSIPRYSAFTDNEVDDQYPVLAGGGDFAWLRGATVFEAVHYWNEAFHSESVISDTCCPTSSYTNGRPAADDGDVVWRAYDRGGSGGHRLLMWNGVLTDLSDDIGAAASHEYSLHDGDLAYEWGASPSTVMYWDGAVAQIVAQGYAPSLYDGSVAFEVWDGHDWEIRLWDGAEIIEITDNDINDTQATFHDGVIAWSGRPSAGKGQIYYVRLDEE